MLTSVRDPHSCPFRREANDSGVTCELLRDLLDRPNQYSCEVSPEACVVCCQQPAPSREQFNSVIASLLYEALASTRAIDERWSGRHEELLKKASDALELFSRARPPLKDWIDQSFTADVLATHVDRGESFVLLRFGDGEWLSALGAVGHNCDRHQFMPETMGRELRGVVRSLSSGDYRTVRLYVGTTCELPDLVLPYLSAFETLDRVHWVSDAVFRLGMHDLRTRQFVIACQRFRGRKVVVGSAALRPVARALNAHHVIIPAVNCYLEIDAIEATCRSTKADLLLCCASMASECLLWRLANAWPEAMLVDCGSIFDVMLQRPIRGEYREWSELIAESYYPMFAPFVHDEKAR